ncbi:Anoctamin-8 [Lucilia cuprina]|nr:Anoctamin-8 [Lucilia cuprina]
MKFTTGVKWSNKNTSTTTTTSKDWWDSKLPETGIFCCLSVIPKVLLAGAITLMDEAYYKLAVWLNDKENYRLQSKYENHLIAKVALFQFVNSFLSLFYIAFYLRDEEKLKEQLAGLLISRQIIGNLRESAIPYFLEQWKLAKLSFNMWGALSPTQDINRTFAGTLTSSAASAATAGSTTVSTDTEKTKQPSETSTPQSGTPSKQLPKKSLDTGCSTPTTTTASAKRNIGQAEIESSLYKYDGTFSDHLEMLVQMGYVVLFSAAFPLAGVCALINNLMEIRSDAFKLAHVHQRPFGQRVANIGTWQNALSLLSLAAVIVNCALIGLSGQVSRLWPGLTTAQTIILIVTLEHIMLGLRSALTWLLPELPSWLAAEIARAEHCRREMQCKGTSPRPTPPTPPSTTSTQPEHELAALNLLDAVTGTTNNTTTTNEQSMDSQMSEELLYQQELLKQNEYEPYIDEITRFGLQRNVAAGDLNVFDNRDSSPDSPPSQTSTILIRPLLDSTPPNSGASLTSLNQDILTHGPSGACKSCKQKKKIPEIPPFHGYSVRNLSSIPIQRLHALMGASASSLALNTRQPMHIPEIPPFRKKSSDSADHTGSSTSSSPQRTSAISIVNAAAISNTRQPLIATPLSSSPPTLSSNPNQQTSAKIPEIPPYKARKISAESTTHLNLSDKYTLKTHAPEWMSRLKVSDNINLHRSIDCIAKELKSNTDTMDILKPAPSWSNVAIKTQPQQVTTNLQAQQATPTPPLLSSSATAQHLVASSSSSSGGGVSVSGLSSSKPETSTTRPSVGGISNSSASSLQQQQNEKDPANTSQQQQQQQQQVTKTTSGSVTTPSGAATDDEAKAAELAAKKSRLKQKLVKSARSVAIFSLKLKERRQREAEKAAAIAVEHAKVRKMKQKKLLKKFCINKMLAQVQPKLPPMPQAGGELSLIPIEQLIKIEDIKPALRSPPPVNTTALMPFSTTASTSSAITLANTSTTSSALLAAAAAHLQQQQQQQQQHHNLFAKVLDKDFKNWKFFILVACNRNSK